MFNLKVEFYLKIIFAICFVALASAYFIEYILGHQPCNLCIIERIPYVVGLFLIISIYILKKNEKFHVLLLILTFIFSLIISIYHFGIEQNFFQESAVCDTKDLKKIVTIQRSLAPKQVLHQPHPVAFAPVQRRLTVKQVERVILVQVTATQHRLASVARAVGRPLPHVSCDVQESVLILCFLVPNNLKLVFGKVALGHKLVGRPQACGDAPLVGRRKGHPLEPRKSRGLKP